ncbi:hypothetical protein C8R45DRAFT_944012 [Mycena sanguinolenta]|nr:hypothetical protein C8R45DRAFT_944012 [Mycena sanguinolenta]
MNCGRTGDTKNWTGDMKNAERAGDTTMNEQRKGTRTRNKMAPVTRAAEGARSLARLWLREPRDCCAVVEISSGDAVACGEMSAARPRECVISQSLKERGREKRGECYTGRRRLPIEGGSNATPLYVPLDASKVGGELSTDPDREYRGDRALSGSSDLTWRVNWTARAGSVSNVTWRLNLACRERMNREESGTDVSPYVARHLRDEEMVPNTLQTRLFNYTFRGPIGQGGNNKPSGWHTILCGGSVPFWKSGAGVRKSRSKERRRKCAVEICVKLSLRRTLRRQVNTTRREVEPTDRQTGTRWTEREVKGRDDAAAWVGVGWIGWNENLGDDGGETTARKALIGKEKYQDGLTRRTSASAFGVRPVISSWRRKGHKRAQTRDSSSELQVVSNGSLDSIKGTVIDLEMQHNIETRKAGRESRSSEAQRGVRTESTRQPKYPESASTAEKQRRARIQVFDSRARCDSRVGGHREEHRRRRGREGRAGRGGEWNGEKRGKWKAEEARPTREVVEGGVMGRGGGEKERGSDAHGRVNGNGDTEQREVVVTDWTRGKHGTFLFTSVRKTRGKAEKCKRSGGGQRKGPRNGNTREANGKDGRTYQEPLQRRLGRGSEQRVQIRSNEAKRRAKNVREGNDTFVRKVGTGGCSQARRRRRLRRDENGDWDGAGAARGDQGGIPPEGARACIFTAVCKINDSCEKKKKKENNSNVSDCFARFSLVSGAIWLNLWAFESCESGHSDGIQHSPESVILGTFENPTTRFEPTERNDDSSANTDPIAKDLGDSGGCKQETSAMPSKNEIISRHTCKNEITPGYCEFNMTG